MSDNFTARSVDAVPRQCWTCRNAELLPCEESCASCYGNDEHPNWEQAASAPTIAPMPAPEMPTEPIAGKKTCDFCKHRRTLVTASPCNECFGLSDKPRWECAFDVNKMVDDCARNVNKSLLDIQTRTTTAITPAAETPGAFGGILTGVYLDPCGLLELKIAHVAPEILDTVRPGAYVEVRKLCGKRGEQ